MAHPFLSVIIPSYNEAQRLPLTLVDIDKHLSRADYSYEILVVNDGSKDNTAEIVRAMAKMIKNLKLIDNETNKGKGGAVRQGMLLAQGQIRLFTDADNSTSIDQFNNMLPYFTFRGAEDERPYDVVIGSRTVKGAELDPPEPVYRQIPGKLGNLLIQTLLLPGIWDTQCGFKAFTAECAEKVFELSKISGWGFDAEVLAIAKALGYKIKEIPVHWINDTRSHVKASAYLKVFLDVFKIRWWLWTNKYQISSIRHKDPEIKSRDT